MLVSKILSTVRQCRAENSTTGDGLECAIDVAPPPVSVTKYISEQWALCDDEQFRAIPVRRVIRAQTPKWQTAVQRNQERAWAARCRRSPCRQVYGSFWDLKYVWCKWETEYLS